jgi:hypothetical protein
MSRYAFFKDEAWFVDCYLLRCSKTRIGSVKGAQNDVRRSFLGCRVACSRLARPGNRGVGGGLITIAGAFDFSAPQSERASLPRLRAPARAGLFSAEEIEAIRRSLHAKVSARCDLGHSLSTGTLQKGGSTARVAISLRAPKPDAQRQHADLIRRPPSYAVGRLPGLRQA